MNNIFTRASFFRFLEITLMRMSVCVSVCPPPRLLETSGVICGVM